MLGRISVRRKLRRELRSKISEIVFMSITLYTILKGEKMPVFLGKISNIDPSQGKFDGLLTLKEKELRQI